MIVEFSVGNFRSINEVQTLSFAATGLKSAKEFDYVDMNNISKVKNMSLFNTLGIYGANASGKSNVIKALDYFVMAMISQPSSVSNLGQLCQPFLFQENAEDTESFFQIVFIIEKQKYRYGFTVRKNLKEKIPSHDYSSEIITNEWLYADKVKNMSPLFIRERNQIKTNTLKGKNKIPTVVPYQHSLFLTLAAAFDSEGECQDIGMYLRNSVVCNFKMIYDDFRWLAVNSIANVKSGKKDFLQLLQAFDLDYEDVMLDKKEAIDLKQVFPMEKITFQKAFKLNDKRININLNLNEHESSGTQKMFDLAGLLLVIFNLRAPIFIVLDEIDSNFHPALLIKLIRLFNDPRINKNNCQLLFTSHDTNLMSPSIMRRDQFYFTEKREDFSTRLYSLADLKGIRNDADFAKDYLAGYYGGVPVLTDYYSPENERE